MAKSNDSTGSQHDLDETLLEPFQYISSVPGKNVRGKLIDCFQFWFKVKDDGILEAIKDIVGDLHNASLLIDDIEDNSKLRRGIPVAHSIFGVPSVINCANYVRGPISVSFSFGDVLLSLTHSFSTLTCEQVYFLALEKCQALNNPAAMQVFVGELLNLHRGQGYDIRWRELSQCPTEEEYLSMVKDKTGGLFRLGVGLLQAFATERRDDDFTKLVNDLGLYFQIRDDLVNLADEEYMKSKSFCEDITEGKFSFPIVHCIRKESNTRLLSILKQRTDDDVIKRYAQSLIRDMGSLDYTRDKCTSLKEEIVAEVEKFGGNPGLLKLIDLLHKQLENMGKQPVKERGEVEIDEP
jgi:geranylgeranyl diphosphate synthase type 3